MIDVFVASSAWRDQKRIVDYLGSVPADGATLRFLESLDATIAFIAEFPDMGSPWESTNPRRAGFRYRLVTGFENYVVVYQRHDSHMLIARIFHASQNIEEHLK